MGSPNLVAVFCTAWAYVGGLKNLSARVPISWYGACLTPHGNTILLHTCYHSEFGRSKSSRMGAGKGPKIQGSLGPPLGMGGAWQTRRNIPPTPCATVPKLVVLRETVRAYTPYIHARSAGKM